MAAKRANPNWPLRQRVDAQLKQSDSGCIEWTGKRDGRGYGKLTDKGRDLLAHRAAWELANGAIPKGMSVCHRCDNPPCCNTAHLFLGTHQDNMRDASNKGRMGTKTPLRGERNHKAKLTNEQAAAMMAEVRALPRARGGRPAGTLSQRQIAHRYGVSESLISRILMGKCRVVCQ